MHGNPRLGENQGVIYAAGAGVTAVLPAPITVTEVTAFGSGGRANTSQDCGVMTPRL